MPHPDKMASARRSALDALKKLQAGGRRVFRSSNFKPEIRKQLLELGYLQEIMRGWLMASSPKDLPGDTTPWHASFWQFVTAYLDDRFADDWVVSPEQSLSIHAEATSMPRQLLVHSSRGQNNVTKLPHGTSIFDHKSFAMPAANETILIDGLRLWTIPAALIRVPEHYYTSEPMNATGSCPIAWCRIGYLIAFSGWVGRVYQAATAGSLMMGSLHKPAMVSSVM